MQLPFSDAVRTHMLEEIQTDVATGTHFSSPRLSVQGRLDYPSLLKEAAGFHDIAWLSAELNQHQRLRSSETYVRNGREYSRNLPYNASQLIAEGELNRYFMRGLSIYALEHGIPFLQVYRAKPVEHPRPESEAIIGKLVEPQIALDDLRTNKGDSPTFLGIPGGPNSGISLRIPA